MRLNTTGKPMPCAALVHTLPKKGKKISPKPLCFFLLLMLGLQLGGLAQKITLAVKNGDIRAVIRDVEKQSGYQFFYNESLLKKAPPVTVDVKGESLETALRLCFAGQPFSYAIVNKTVVLKEKDVVPKGVNLPPAPPTEAKGRVVNDRGEPVGGAVVKVKGGSQITTTNDNGEFTLNGVVPNATLVVTSLNMQTLETKVSGDAYLTLKMTSREEQLQDVAVTVNNGYQSLSKERSAGSFAKPNMDVFQSRSGSMNVLQRLDGLIPGLTINNAPRSSAGGDNSLLIRGLTSIQGTRSPLYVVDGLPFGNISSLNPNDVESITVLKDATAASIWGSRASNGVVVITTRKGTNDNRIRVDYDGFVNFQGKPNLDYNPVLNSRDFIQAAKDIFDPVNYPWASYSVPPAGSTGMPLPPHEKILYDGYRGIISQATASARLDSLGAINNVQQIKDNFYRNALLTNHTVSVRGGTEKYSFYGSLAYTNDQGNAPGSTNNSFKINFRQDVSFGNRIKAYLITDITNTVASSKNTVFPTNNFLPYQLFRNSDGSSISMPWMYWSDSVRTAYQNQSGISLDYNPLNEVNYSNFKSDALLARVTSGVTVKLLKGLRFEGVYGIVKGNAKNTTLLSQDNYGIRTQVIAFTVPAATAGGKPTYYLPATGSRYTLNNTNQRDWTVRNQLVYDNNWLGGKHQLTVLAGQEAQNRFAFASGSTVYGYNEQLQTYAVLNYAQLAQGINGTVIRNNGSYSALFTGPGIGNSLFTTSEAQTRFVSYYSNAAYTFNRNYTLNGSWRIDQSSLFGKDKSAQNRPVWSVGGSWLLSNKTFMASTQKWLDRLSVRLTYGITGNAPDAGSAASFDILQAETNAIFPGGSGLNIATPANRRLTWESTKVKNAGIDFSIFRRLSGSIDVYQKNTTDLIGISPVNGFSGYSYITGNVGNMTNKGIEVSLNSINMSKKNFTWSSGLSLGFNKNKITKLNQLSAITTGENQLLQQYVQGYAAFSVFAYRFAGLDSLGDPQIQLAKGTITKARGVSTPTDVVYMGSSQPAWSGGLTNTFRYKNLTLTLNAIYNLDYVMRRDVNNFYYGGHTYGGAGSFNSGNLKAEFADRWKKPGDEATTNIPSYISTAGVSNTRRNVNYYTLADINVLNASYVKLRDITLAYSLPQSILTRVKANAIIFRLQVSNIMLWKANKFGIDPEFHDAYGSVSPTGTINGGIRSLPVGQHSLTLGAHVSF